MKIPFRIPTASFLSVLAFAALVFVAGEARQASAGTITYSQIPGPFSTTAVPGGDTYGVSQFDTGAAGSIYRQDYSTSYDSFSFGGNFDVVSFDWVGGYELLDGTGTPTAFADSFDVSIYANDTTGTLANQPGALLYTQNVGSASEAALAGVEGFFTYSASISPFSVTAGDTYWFSSVANLDFLDNEWGIAFSGIGDGTSVNKFANLNTDPFVTSEFGADLAFSVTAVPEPTGLAMFGLLAIMVGTSRRRSSRASAVVA